MWPGTTGREAGGSITAVWEKIRPTRAPDREEQFYSCHPRSVFLLVLTCFLDTPTEEEKNCSSRPEILILSVGRVIIP